MLKIMWSVAPVVGEVKGSLVDEFWLFDGDGGLILSLDVDEGMPLGLSAPAPPEILLSTRNKAAPINMTSQPTAPLGMKDLDLPRASAVSSKCLLLFFASRSTFSGSCFRDGRCILR